MRLSLASAVMYAAAFSSSLLCAQSKPTLGPTPQRDVFVVGADTSIGDPLLGFKPTRVDYTQKPMDTDGRRELIRMFLMEQGFAHRALPLGAPGLQLHANGRLTVDNDTLKKRMYKDGIAAAAGDRIMVTDINVLPDRIDIDINGGPYVKHRFLRHISVNNIQLASGDITEKPSGTRITLLFEGKTPRLSAAEIKALLEPLLDFGLKNAEQAYADTLPEPVRQAIAEHQVMVGMNRRMVLASLGQPDSKLRERPLESTDGEVFEEWIYGKTPQSIRFVRFRADRVILMKLAALGKPIEVHDRDELAGYREPVPTHQVLLGDSKPDTEEGVEKPKAPSLKLPSERKPTPTTTPVVPVADKVAANETPHLQ